MNLNKSKLEVECRPTTVSPDEKNKWHTFSMVIRKFEGKVKNFKRNVGRFL